jgi:hypothetical protein
MKRRLNDNPPERSRQLDLIKAAKEKTLRWAAHEAVPLKRIEPVVPFVDADFSLDAWLFFDTESNVARFRSDGTGDRVVAQFRSNLAGCGYPAEWLSLVVCRFSSVEVVDRDYQGSYFYFLC